MVLRVTYMIRLVDIHQTVLFHLSSTLKTYLLFPIELWVLRGVSCPLSWTCQKKVSFTSREHSLFSTLIDIYTSIV